MNDPQRGVADTVVVTAAPAAVFGLAWNQARQYLPSIDSPNMRAWLSPRGADIAVIVIPADRWPCGPPGVPHRQICVPPREFALFSEALEHSREHGRSPRVPPEQSLLDG